jgi:hypothetical protein
MFLGYGLRKMFVDKVYSKGLRIKYKDNFYS